MTEKTQLTPDMTETQDATDTPDVLTNQTQFASEEPLFQKRAELIGEEKDPEEEAKKKKAQRRLYFIFGGFIAFFVVCLVLLVIFAPKQMQKITKTTPTQQSTTSLPAGELQQHLLSAQQDFKDADPTRNDLPFPPVNGNLSLDGQQ